MTPPAHTSGPWKASGAPIFTIEPGRCIHRDGRPFAIVHRATDNRNPPPAGADVDDFARLCAAAPDLLAALKNLASAYRDLVRELDPDPDVTELPSPELDAADLAIAKAEGGE